MGLDGVELVLGFEEAFGIAISDEEAQSLQTPRDVMALVEKRVSPGPKPCSTQHCFYRIRRALESEFQIPREWVIPGADIRTLLPKGSMKSQWRRLRAAVDVSQWPDLERPRWFRPVTAAGLLSCVGLAMFGGVLGVAVAFVLLAVLLRVYGVSQTRIPERLATVGALAERIATDNPTLGAGDSPRWMSIGIAAEVRRVIRDTLGIEEFGDDDHFVRDLGVG